MPQRKPLVRDVGPETKSRVVFRVAARAPSIWMSLERRVQSCGTMSQSSSSHTAAEDYVGRKTDGVGVTAGG
jgi:hypothetical protein